MDELKETEDRLKKKAEIEYKHLEEKEIEAIEEARKYLRDKCNVFESQASISMSMSLSPWKT